MPTIIPESYLNVAVCSVVVVFYAANRFGTLQNEEFKPPSRSTTTQGKYVFYLAAYVLFSLVMLALLTQFQKLSLPLFGVSVQDHLKQLPPLYLAVLLLTLLLPNVPRLKEIDEKIRGKLFEWASIPSEALWLKDRLMRSEVFGPAERRKAVEEAIAALQLQAAGPQAASRALETEFTKVLLLMQAVGSDEVARIRWLAGLLNMSGEFGALSKRRDELVEDLKERLAAVGDQEPVAHTTRLAAKLDQLYAARVHKLHEDLCRLLARVALQATSQRRRDEFLKALGYQQLAEAREALPVGASNLMCMVVFVVFGSMLAAFVLLANSPLQSSEPFAKILTRTSMIAVMYGGAVVSSLIVLKRLSSSGTMGSGQNWAAYLGALGLAAVIGAVTSYVFKFIDSAKDVFLTPTSEPGDWPAVFAQTSSEFSLKAPWLLVAPIVAAICTWRADRPQPAAVDERKRLRWEDTVWVAVANTAVVIVAILLLVPAARPWGSPPSWVMGAIVVAVVVVVGTAVGYSVPSASREMVFHKALPVTPP